MLKRSHGRKLSHLQVEEKRDVMSQAATVDDMYDMLAAYEQKVPTSDQVKHDDLREAANNFTTELANGKAYTADLKAQQQVRMERTLLLFTTRSSSLDPFHQSCLYPALHTCACCFFAFPSPVFSLLPSSCLPFVLHPLPRCLAPRFEHKHVCPTACWRACATGDAAC